MEKQDYSINVISMIFQNMNKCGLRITKPELDLCEECTNGPLCKLLYNPCPAKLVYTKLSQYEDTGLTPKEVQAMRWIPVEERLPGVSGNYICAVKDKNGSVWTIPAEWSLEMKMWTGAFGEIKNIVTHWMHLPQPPKEETHEK